MLSAYSTTRDQLLALIRQLEGVVSAEHFKNTLDAVSRKLIENQFTLVIIGQFKRGKTTFINALLGRDLLPTAIIPLTSIITILKYGEDLHIEVFFANGAVKEIQHDQLSDYVTEKHNPKNEKGVDHVVVSYPSTYLKSGVEIVDTPGIASVHEHNTQVTYQYLPQADAAVFLVSVDPPITQAELHFLKDIKKDISKLFFVQNKIDVVNESDWEESLAFTKKVIEDEAGLKNVLMYPLSAKDALEGKLEKNQEKIKRSGVDAFERKLDTFLMEEKGSVLLHSVSNKLMGIISQEMLFVEIEQKSLHTPLAELKTKMESLGSSFAELEQEQSDIANLLRGEIATLVKDVLEKDLERLRQEKTQWLIREVERFYDLHRSNGTAELERTLEAYINQQIQDMFGTWSIEEEKVLKAHLEKILGRFASRMNSIMEKIITVSLHLFDIPVKPVLVEEPLAAETEFWFKLKEDEDSLSMLIESITRTLPKIIGHKIVLKAAKERAAMLVDRHCGRLRYDFVQRIEKNADDYEKSVRQNADAIKENITAALRIAHELKERSSQEIGEREKIITAKLALLSELGHEIQNIQNAL